MERKDIRELRGCSVMCVNGRCTPEFGVGCRDDADAQNGGEIENALLFANTCGMLVDALPLSALPDEDVNHYASSFSRSDRGKSTLFDNDDEDFNEKPVRTKASTVKKGTFDAVKVPPLLKRQLASLWNPPSSILSFAARECVCRQST